MIAELTVEFDLCVCLAGQMVLRRNATCVWQTKKPFRRQPINGAWRTCNGNQKLIDQKWS